MDTGWLHMKLNTLLPNYKRIGGTQYISDTITRLLDQFQKDGGKLPMFDKAFLAIVEHCDFNCSEVFDHKTDKRLLSIFLQQSIRVSFS